MKKERIYFYLLRLKNSSFSELIFRAEQFFLVKKLKRQLKKNKNLVQVPALDLGAVKSLQLPTLSGHVDESSVQEILGGFVLNLNTDPSAIADFEQKKRNSFFDDIKSIDQNPDIRAVWEPARLQHIAILFSHLLNNSGAKNAQGIKLFAKKVVLAWISENPFLKGPHYGSAMECGLRIPVFFQSLKLLDNLDDGEKKLILGAIYRHGWWVSNNLSLYSSLGNHTIAESVGLIFAGAAFININEGEVWLKRGYDLLKQELEHQVLDDGGPAEQSLSYHRFVLDLSWLAVDFLEKNHLFNCTDFKEQLMKGECFLSAVRTGRDSLPSIGDNDDGHAVAPGLHPKRLRSENNENIMNSFPTSGYTIIKDNDFMLTFDHGPLGMPPLYNHGHADALSITLCVNGKKILVDPGTYRYNGPPAWRSYFRGTRAHNTVTIDGADQAVQQTGFIWSRPYRAELVKNLQTCGLWILQARHNGYARLKYPVIHTRTVIRFDGMCFYIKDTFSGKGVHDFELNFHLYPDAEVRLRSNGWWETKNDGVQVFLKLLEDRTFSLFKGTTYPVFGWYSPAYGVKHESRVLSCSKNGFPENISFKTVVVPQPPEKLDKVEDRLHELDRQAENS